MKFSKILLTFVGNEQRKEQWAMIFIYVSVLLIQGTTGLTIDGQLDPSKYSSLVNYQAQQSQLKAKETHERPLYPRRPMNYYGDKGRLLKQKVELMQRHQAKLEAAEKLTNPFTSENQRTSTTKPFPSSTEPTTHHGITDVQHWSKRDSQGKSGAKSKSFKELTAARGRKFLEEDKAYDRLKALPECVKQLGKCASKMPFQLLQCFLNCYVTATVVAVDSLKFLYRLPLVLISFLNQWCPSFGTAYKTLLNIISDPKGDFSVHGFAKGIGLDLGSSEATMFLRNAPSALVNTLVLIGSGPEFALIKPFVLAQENTLSTLTEERSLFPAALESPLCQKMTKPSWFAGVFDHLAKHPVTSDFILRGFYLITRVLTRNLPAPTEGLFLALFQAMKTFIGIDCSLVAYAEIGVNFKCLQAPNLDELHAFYEQESKRDENPLNSFVCGAHQIEPPEFTQAKQTLGGRGEGDGMKSDVDEAMKVVDKEGVPNPEEADDYEDVNNG